ncbi:hypothetical protein B0H13DRAFT_1853223 [Mycena leptocephala]|nr:hypothetical protein B0H13DRAFT_1853223 [Mycena leptocephala]
MKYSTSASGCRDRVPRCLLVATRLERPGVKNICMCRRRHVGKPLNAVSKPDRIFASSAAATFYGFYHCKSTLRSSRLSDYFCTSVASLLSLPYVLPSPLGPMASQTGTCASVSPTRCKSPRLAAKGFQSMKENIHPETYSLLIDTCIKEAAEGESLLDGAEAKSPPLSSVLSRDLIFWPIRLDLLDEEALSYARLTFSNELISRDGGMHTDFRTLRRIITEAVAIEKECPPHQSHRHERQTYVPARAYSQGQHLKYRQQHRTNVRDSIVRGFVDRGMNIVNLILFQSSDTVLQPSASTLGFAATISSRFAPNLSEHIRGFSHIPRHVLARVEDFLAHKVPSERRSTFFTLPSQYFSKEQPNSGDYNPTAIQTPPADVIRTLVDAIWKADAPDEIKKWKIVTSL